MNDFERKIREALNLQRENDDARQQNNALNLSHQASLLATTSLVGATMAGLKKTESSGNAHAHTPTHALASEPPQGSANADITSPFQTESTLLAARNALSRPGQTYSEWANPLIKAAFPLILMVEQYKKSGQRHDDIQRAQWVREAQYFQQVLLQQGYTSEIINHLTYLLFTWIDETLNRNNTSAPLSLLVEYYQDAWGGEKCFDHLNQYWQSPQTHQDVLQFYDLILSLGFYGKYAMIERGPLLLADLRHQLDVLLYLNHPTQTLADAQSHRVVPKKRVITPLRLLMFGMLALSAIYAYASWRLHDDARTLRNAILAWTPPEPRRINIMSTLPQPLPEILQEGWLEVRKDPQGWLLIFTSDGAFATGKATLLPDFVNKRNIERLGAALAPWPGDLEVIGHTDSEPFRKNPTQSNLILSKERADTVANKLRSVMQTNSKYQRNIDATGKGDTDPLAENTTEAGRKRNRRVDILWKIGQRQDEATQQAVEDVRAAARNP